jgi:hypothetical protein
VTDADLVEGPAFTWPARGIATLAVCAVAYQAHVAWQGFDVAPDQVSLTLWGLGALGLLYGLAHIWVTRTQIDATHIRQKGLTDTEVEMARLTQVKLIYIPFLTWLVAPRLVVRAGGLRTWVFHAADRAVLQRFWQLAHNAQLPPAPPVPPSGS